MRLQARAAIFIGRVYARRGCADRRWSDQAVAASAIVWGSAWSQSNHGRVALVMSERESPGLESQVDRRPPQLRVCSRARSRVGERGRRAVDPTWRDFLGAVIV